MKKLLIFLAFFLLPGATFAADANLYPSTAYVNQQTTFTATLTAEFWSMSYFFVNRDYQAQIINGYWNDDLPGAVMTGCSGTSCTTVPSFVSYSTLLPNWITFTYTPTYTGHHYILFGTQNSGGYFDLNVVEAPTPTPVPPTPTPKRYIANTTVMNTYKGLGSSMVSAYMSIIPAGLAIVGVLIVTLYGIRLLIKWVKGNIGSGGGAGFDDNYDAEVFDLWKHTHNKQTGNYIEGSYEYQEKYYEDKDYFNKLKKDADKI